jgi:glycosyltransferase involved in cell wall biosynthesis
VNDASSTIRVLHLLSAPPGNGRQIELAQFSLGYQLTSLVSRIDRELIQMQVINFAPGDRQAAVMRQLRIPVHEIELSRRRFSFSAIRQLRQHAAQFAPDIIHAWGHTAQLATGWLSRKASTLWSMPATPPDTTHFIDRHKLRRITKQAAAVTHVIYPSQSVAAQYRRLGFPEHNATVIANGVDVERFRPDAKLGQQLRAQLKLEANAFVIGMHAPFTSEFDFQSFIRATAEIIKYHPEVYVLIAGKGAQRGNAGVMAMLGGGTLATRTTLLGEWSDVCALFNACDVVCSSALHDGGAHMLAAAMLCGVPVVGTGKGLQGEVLSKFGVVIEPGSPNGMTRGITKIIEMPPERRVHLCEAARNHVMANHSLQGAVQQYLGLYLQVAHDIEAATAKQALKLQRAASQ